MSGKHHCCTMSELTDHGTSAPAYTWATYQELMDKGETIDGDTFDSMPCLLYILYLLIECSKTIKKDKDAVKGLVDDVLAFIKSATATPKGKDIHKVVTTFKDMHPSIKYRTVADKLVGTGKEDSMYTLIILPVQDNCLAVIT